MRKRMKKYAMVFCLFTFLFVVLGGGLRLNPGAAFLAAATGTPLLIYAFNHLVMAASRSKEFDFRPEEREVAYVSGETNSASSRR
jgi:hypothetical protein